MSEFSRRDFLGHALVAGSACSSLAGLAEGQNRPAQRPNVLLIMTDQQRADSVGAYGNPLVQTPHLDSLAQQGVRFTNCWTQHPVCMPSRASIFTGRYPSAHGVRSNGVPLSRHETTLADVFLQDGYRTGGAGKFHFVPHYNRKLPTMETHPDPYYGFVEFHIGEDGRRGEHELWIERRHPKYAGKPDHQIPIELHNSYWTASHTIDFIRTCANRSEPFFAFCSFVDPHHAYDPPPPYGQMYREGDMPPPLRRRGELADKPPFFQALSESHQQWNERVLHHRAQYYGEVSFIDDSVGRLLAALDEWGIRESTLIVFVSDHGDLLGDHGLFFKGPCHYRSCANVPLIVSWPGHVQQGKTVEAVVQEIDLFPTIADLAGIENPPGVQGRSQHAVLTSDSLDTGYESALIEFGLSGERSPTIRLSSELAVPDHYTLWTPEWRMTYYPGQEYGELYDHASDPHEFVNRWTDPKLEAIKRRLKDHLLDRVLLAHDPLPVREERY